MSSSTPIVEGVLAINKPPAISSAQVIRDVQEHFNPSELFKPWLQREQAKRNAESHNQKQKRRNRWLRVTSVKMGHGGTLDPMATGVLILGVGRGTKQLGFFSTECTKIYETVLLFGVATDSYDTEGKIVGRKPYEHITKELVEEKLAAFRGKGVQTPPIFSARRVQGKRLYEYAREGKEVPIKIEERPVEVHDLEMTEWSPGGTHKWHWPETEAEPEKKQLAVKELHLEGQNDEPLAVKDSDFAVIGKRKREGGYLEEPVLKRPKSNDTDAVEEQAAEDRDAGAVESEIVVPTTNKGTTAADQIAEDRFMKPERDTDVTSSRNRPPCPAPACRIRMKVTSGFYVRSLCHDLGAAVGSLGIMAELVRTRQGDFELGKNVLLYDELKQGEDVWGPKVQQMLESWVDRDSPGQE